MLIQPIAQIAALAVMRARGEKPPFRMWLYPIPPIVALIAWVFVFYSSGPTAMAFGVATLALGCVVYLITARAQRAWPFQGAGAGSAHGKQGDPT